MKTLQIEKRNVLGYPWANSSLLALCSDLNRIKGWCKADEETVECSLCLDIPLLAAVGLIWDGALQSAAFQQRKKNLVSEIVSGAYIAEGLHFSPGSGFGTILQQRIELCNIKLYGNCSIIDLTT